MSQETAQLLLFGELVPTGSGEYRIRPRKPVAYATPKQAASILGISRSGVYQLIDRGYFTVHRPSPGKILIDIESLTSHKAATSDPEFWSRQRKSSQS